jgi:HEAT repeat protein
MREIDDSWSTAELIEAAFLEKHGCEPDSPCPATMALHARGNREVLEAALTLCRSLDPEGRSLGAAILGELGFPDRTFPEECCDALVGLLRHDPSQEVVTSAVYALGHLGNRRCDPDLLALKDHPEPAIRKGVAFSLIGTTLPAAVPVLLQLMEDLHEETRDWATTTLGQAVCFDSDEIRDALLRRAATDSDDITRGEALCGLGRRGDRRGVPLLIKELARIDEQCTSCIQEAAKAYLGIDEDEDVASEELIDALRATRH